MHQSLGSDCCSKSGLRPADENCDSTDYNPTFVAKNKERRTETCKLLAGAAAERVKEIENEVTVQIVCVDLQARMPYQL